MFQVVIRLFLASWTDLEPPLTLTPRCPALQGDWWAQETCFRRPSVAHQGGGGTQVANGYPLPNSNEERKQLTPKYNGGQLIVGQIWGLGVVNFKLSNV